MSNGNVFISGASRGIGNSIAYHFAENDYVVVGTSRNEFEFDKNIIKGIFQDLYKQACEVD